jgi:hypothetical protein
MSPHSISLAGSRSLRAKAFSQLREGLDLQS